MLQPTTGGRGRRLRDDPLLSLLAWNWIAGAVVAVALAAAVLVFDIGRLRSLILGSDDPVVPVVMLVIGFLITLCSVTMGTAVMGLGRDDDDRDGGRPVGDEAPMALAVPARRRATARAGRA